MVEQRLGERLHRARRTRTDSCTASSTKRPAPPAEEPELVVRIEAAVADPGAPEHVPPRDANSRRPPARRSPRPGSARCAAASSGVTRSSASSDSTQSPVACSSAKFFWAAKPGQGRTQTRSVNSRASATVLSVDSPSTTMISSAQATLSRQARRRSSSFQRHDGDAQPAHRAPPPSSSAHARRRTRASGVSPAMVPSGLCSPRHRGP